MVAAYRNFKATLGPQLTNGDQPVLVKPGTPAGATLVTDLATTATAIDTFAAAVLAITGDTYDTTTKQFTFGGATGLTHAEVATVFALFNTMTTAFLTAQADTTGIGVADVQVTFDVTNVVTRSRLAQVFEQMKLAIAGSGALTP